MTVPAQPQPQPSQENALARLIAPRVKSPVRLAVLVLLLVLWIAFLIALYFYAAKPARDARPKLAPTTVLPA